MLKIKAMPTMTSETLDTTIFEVHSNLTQTNFVSLLLQNVWTTNLPVEFENLI